MARFKCRSLFFVLLFMFFISGLSVSMAVVSTAVAWSEDQETERLHRRVDSLRHVIEIQQGQIEALSSRLETRATWMARALVSETNSTLEMRYVAWVIRNRVELGWRGKTTYRGVILDPYQFSAFNPNSATRQYFMTLTAKNSPHSAQFVVAKQIAREVITAPRSSALLPRNVTHFYSPVSMEGAPPTWAWTLDEVRVESVEDHRFKFYKI